MKIQAKDCHQGGLFRMEPEPGTTETNTLGPEFVYTGQPPRESRLCFTNARFSGYDSPQAATLISFPTKTATWDVAAGGRIGMVIGRTRSKAAAVRRGKPGEGVHRWRPHVTSFSMAEGLARPLRSQSVKRPIGILYEHPLWFEPLFAELDRRGVAYEKLLADRLVFDPGERESRYSLVVNRMSPSAWTRGHGRAIFHSLHFLAYLDEIGAPVVNGHAAFQVEISKARQCALFARLGIRYPASRAVADRRELPTAAEGLRFPVLVKPNVGGSGAGIRSFATAAEVREAAADESLEVGVDGTAVVQEHLPAADESIVRIEILNGEFLYALRLRLLPGSFNLCPADYCDLPGIADGVSGRGLPVERYEPPSELIEAAKRIVAAAGMELGGVEYLVSARDGLAYFYDVNALSNFVANAPEVVGFDPFVNLVDCLVERARSRDIGAETGLARRVDAAA